MPIPQFSPIGLLPEGIHDCSLEDIANSLCGNGRREEIFNDLVAFLAWTSAQPGPVGVYVDGSFVTNKTLPGDIDVVIDITNCDEAGQGWWLRQFHLNHDAIKAQFSVDFYPQILNQGHQLTGFFQYVRVEEALSRGASPDTRKGILRLAA